MSFDIVIPLGPNELALFSTQLDFTKKKKTTDTMIQFL